jgi:hypothetical protein
LEVRPITTEAPSPCPGCQKKFFLAKEEEKSKEV